VLRGRPLAVEVIREHDEHGRVVRERHVREAEWLDSDRAFALALTEHEQSLCPCGCGQPKDLAWNPDSAGWWEVAHLQCQAAAAKAEYAKANKLGDGDMTVVRLGLPPGRELLPIDMGQLLVFSSSTDEDDPPPPE
jgi:hypothetical protein